MIYSRQDLLDIWAGIQKSPAVPTFENITSRDVIRCESSPALCPKCKKLKRVLVKVGSWGCYECNKVNNNHPTFYRNTLVYLITNDLLAYFGEVTTEKILDPDLMNAFIKFTNAEASPIHFLLINKFVKAVLTKDIGVLPILSFLTTSEAKLKKMQGVDKIHGNSGKNKINEPSPAQTSGLDIPTP